MCEDVERVIEETKGMLGYQTRRFARGCITASEFAFSIHELAAVIVKRVHEIGAEKDAQS